jgi:hypothetical protein
VLFFNVPFVRGESVGKQACLIGDKCGKGKYYMEILRTADF